MKRKDHFEDLGLMDMDIEEMCDELGITQEDIIERFKERVWAYERSIDTGIERDISERSFEDEDADYEETHDKHFDEYTRKVHNPFRE